MEFVKEFLKLNSSGKDTTEVVNKVRVEILTLLKDTHSLDEFKLVKSILHKYNYFSATSSIGYHLDGKGGLAVHSLSLYHLLTKMNEQFSAGLDHGVMVVSSIFHDLCKCVNYEFDNSSGKFKYTGVYGHSAVTLSLLEDSGYYLDPKSSLLIKYHMGAYGTKEFKGEKKGEYTLKEYIKAVNENKDILLFHSADNLSAQFLEC